MQRYTLNSYSIFNPSFLAKLHWLTSNVEASRYSFRTSLTSCGMKAGSKSSLLKLRDIGAILPLLIFGNFLLSETGSGFFDFEWGDTSYSFCSVAQSAFMQKNITTPVVIYLFSSIKLKYIFIRIWILLENYFKSFLTMDKLCGNFHQDEFLQ